jgi:hypothetical protein
MNAWKKLKNAGEQIEICSKEWQWQKMSRLLRASVVSRAQPEAWRKEDRIPYKDAKSTAVTLQTRYLGKKIAIVAS